MLNSIEVVGPGDVDFRFLLYRFGGFAGAREAFERLCADIVGVTHPDVQEVQANPGDWGIDAFVGDLGPGGEVHVWQSKYFIDGFDKSQQRDVRESYDSAKKAAAISGYVLSSWTLCIPREMDPKNSVWWNGWRRRTEKADGVTIQLWSEGVLRRRLQAPDGKDVREHYFNPVFRAPEAPKPTEPPRGLHELAEDDAYEGTLFVRQLKEAGLPETFSAREAFYNAEILAREVSDKALAVEVSALATWRVRVHSTWSSVFNSACQLTPQRVLPGLYDGVMSRIEAHTSEAEGLRANVVHGFGLLHQAVDSGRAGWVRDWRRVATEFNTSPRASSDTEAAGGKS